VARKNWSVKNRNDPTVNRARELQAYSAVPCNFSMSTNELINTVELNLIFFGKLIG
jgi:hypothetical protein